MTLRVPQDTNGFDDDQPAATWYALREDYLIELLTALGVKGVDQILLELYHEGLEEDSLVALMLVQHESHGEPYEPESPL